MAGVLIGLAACQYNYEGNTAGYTFEENFNIFLSVLPCNCHQFHSLCVCVCQTVLLLTF